MNLQDLLLKHTDKYLENIAFQMKGKDGKYRQWSYGEVKKTASALAGRLHALGIVKGDRVALLSENRPEWPISYLAITALGAVVVPLDILLKKEAIQALLSQCSPKAIITSLRARQEIGTQLVPLELKMEDFSQLIAGAAAFYFPAVTDDDLAALIYTSGTTSDPKGVMLSHGNLMSDILSLTEHFIKDIKPEDNFMSILPLHHTYECTGTFLFAFYNGARVTYAESMIPEHILANMRETKTSVMHAVPLFYKLLLNGIMREVGEKGIITSLLFRLLLGIAMVLPNQSSRRALFSMIHKQLGGNIKMWLSGAAPLDPHVLKGFDLFGIPIYQGYGMTEASPVITCSSPRRNRIGAVGPALPKVEIKIDKESSEIIVRGPNVMKGYYKRPDLTAEAIKDGWLYTGDVGYLDRDGFLFVTGRLKDVIVTASGKNIYPQDLEMMFSRIKGIKEVCVLGVRIKKGVGVGGEEAGMIIIPDLKYFETEKVQDQTRIEKILKKQVANLNASLPMYQRVGRIKFRYQDFPKTTTRKIKRKELIKEVGEF